MFAVLLVAAAVCSALSSVVARQLAPSHAYVATAAAILTALLIIAAGGALILEHRALEPLRHLTDVARDIAAGNLARRMPDAGARDLRDLCSYIDRLALRGSEDQAHVVRAENLASLGLLAGSLAYELGNPLGALRGQLHVLRKQLQGTDTSDSASVCDALDQECARIERILRGLLAYARTRPPASMPVMVNDVLRNAVEALRARNVLVGVHLTIDVPPEPLYVSADRHDLEQSFLAIFENAVEAMNGRGHLVVRLERAARFTLREPAHRRDGDPNIEHPPSTRAQRWLAGNDATDIAKIIIADSGPGVPAALVDRIFDPFFTTKPTGRAAGLGLAIVARVVESFHGSVWVTKAREGGAAFHLLFPTTPAPAVAAPPSITGRRRATPPLARPRV
jgi:signal transduction histidine kinase